MHKDSKIKYMANTGYLQDGIGNNSVTRVMFVVIIIYSMFMTTAVWFATKDYVASLAMFSAITGLAITLKLGQKSMEKDISKSE